MSDLILVSNLASPPSSRVLQALDNAGLHTVDLLSLDVFEIHRRTRLSVIDVQNLVRDVIAALSDTVENNQKRTAKERDQAFAFLTTGDKRINELLGGGIYAGSLTEVTGERFNTISMRLTSVVLENRSYVYSCVFMYNYPGLWVDSTQERFTSALNHP
jgi:Rad51